MADQELMPMMPQPPPQVQAAQQPGNMKWQVDMSQVCDDGPTWCTAVFAPCWRWSETMSRAQILSFRTAMFYYMVGLFMMFLGFVVLAYNPQTTRNPFQAPLIIGALLFWGGMCAGLGWRMWGRRQLRHRYAIDGSDCADCIAHSSLSTPALVQEARHVDLVEP